MGVGNSSNTFLHILTMRPQTQFPPRKKTHPFPELADWVVQFHSADDHLIPIAEGRFVAREIGEAKGAATYCYRELEGEGHFFGPCDEILKEIDKRVAGGGGGDDAV